MRIEVTVAFLAVKHSVSPELVREIMKEAADIIVYDLHYTSFWMHIWLALRRACSCCCVRIPSRMVPVY
jgi:hypothetical protein